MTRVKGKERREKGHALAMAACLSVCIGIGIDAQVIDRILAVVDTTIITLSDAAGAIRLGLVPAVVDEDPVPTAVERLIERQLMLAEVDRYAQPPPGDAEVETKLAEIRGRFAAPGQFERVLAESALSLGQLQRLVRDDLRITAYLDQRFGSGPQRAAQVQDWINGLRRRANITVMPNLQLPTSNFQVPTSK